MANNKAKRNIAMVQLDPLFNPHHPVPVGDNWWSRHPAAYVHATIHGIGAMLVFGYWPAVILAIVHLVIDCRWVVVKWSQLIGQTQPAGLYVDAFKKIEGEQFYDEYNEKALYDVGTEVRFWTDQVFHIVTIAIAALVVSAL